MIHAIRPKTMGAISLVVFACHLFSACGQSKVDFQKRTNSGPTISSSQNISLASSCTTTDDYAGVIRDVSGKFKLGDSSALSQLQTVASCDGFPWDRFWNSLDQISLASLPDETFQGLMDLHKKSCQPSTLHSFLDFAAKQLPRSLTYFYGDSLSCHAILSPRATGSLIQSLYRQSQSSPPSQASVAAARLLLNQRRMDVPFSSQTVTSRWDEIFTSLGYQQWDDILEHLSSSSISGSNQEPLSLYRQLLIWLAIEHPDHRFERRIMMALTASPEAFGQRFASILTLSDALQFLNAIAPPALSSESLQSLRQNLATLFEREASAISQTQRSERVHELWRQYMALRLRENQMERSANTPATQRLAWMERVQRILWNQVNEMEAREAHQFLFQQAHSFDRSWFLVLLGRSYAPALQTLRDEPAMEEPPTLLERHLSKRVALYIGNSALVREYCRYLRSIGLPSESISLAQFRSQLDSQAFRTEMQSPGCTSVMSPPPRLPSAPFAEINITSTQPLSWSWDRVLALPHQRVTWHAPSWSGGVIDMSSHYLWDDLPRESTPASSDGLTVPVLFGFPVATAGQGGSGDPVWDALRPDQPAWEYVPNYDRAGVYWILIHVPLRDPQPGAASQTIPQAGYAGGSLEIHTSSQARSEAPLFFAEGGLGQKAPPARRGGRRGLSLLRRTTIRTLREVLENEDFMRTGAQRDHFLYATHHQSRLTLRHLMTRAGINPDQPLWFTEHRNYPFMTVRHLTTADSPLNTLIPENLQEQLCPRGQMTLHECFESVVREPALRELARFLIDPARDNPEQRGQISPDARIPSQFIGWPYFPGLEAMQFPFAPSGPQTPDGTNGAAGSFQFNHINLFGGP